MFTATKRFVVLKDMVVHMKSHLDGDFEDNVMKVEHVPVLGSENLDTRKNEVSKNLEEDDTDYYAHERKKRRASTEENGMFINWFSLLTFF